MNDLVITETTVVDADGLTRPQVLDIVNRLTLRAFEEDFRIKEVNSEVTWPKKYPGWDGEVVDVAELSVTSDFKQTIETAIKMHFGDNEKFADSKHMLLTAAGNFERAVQNVILDTPPEAVLNFLDGKGSVEVRKTTLDDEAINGEENDAEETS